MEMRTTIKVIGAIISAAIAAISFCFNALNFKPDISWDWIALASFVVFVGFVFWGWRGAEFRARRLEYARPSVVFMNLSPTTITVHPINKKGFFTRLEFVNNTAYPTGDNSTAQDLAASIRVIDESNLLIDSWDGRWANVDEPKTPSAIWSANKIALPANNQRAILDIGYRLEDEKVFNGWDNAHYVYANQRVSIQPGVYELQIELAASNMDYRNFVFSLVVPDEPQANENNVVVKLMPF